MKNLNPEFCRKIKVARRDAGLTQSQVAKEVCCKQSALSAFEQGDGKKLNDEVIARLSKKFNVPLPTENAAPLRSNSVWASPNLVLTKGFCPNPHCPSNHAYQIEEKVLLRPDRAAADPVGGKYCAVCGELLERSCPNCGSPVHDGAICSLCGEPYVTVA